MSVISKPMKFNSRFVAPDAPTDNVCTDVLYSVYACTYEDYLKRVQDSTRDRPYVGPPAFPSGKSVTVVSWALQRRLFAMYADVVKGQTFNEHVPGYCYMRMFSDKQQAEKVARQLGPYPVVSDVDRVLKRLGLECSAYITEQQGGILHVHSTDTLDVTGKVSYIKDISQYGIGWRVGASVEAESKDMTQVVVLQDESTSDMQLVTLSLGINVLRPTSVVEDLAVMGTRLPAQHAIILAPGQKAIHSSGAIIGSSSEVVSVHALVDTRLYIHDPHIMYDIQRPVAKVMVGNSGFVISSDSDYLSGSLSTAHFFVFRKALYSVVAPIEDDRVQRVDLNDSLDVGTPVHSRYFVKRNRLVSGRPYLYNDITASPVIIHSVRTDDQDAYGVVNCVVSTRVADVRIAALGRVTVQVGSSGLGMGNSMSVHVQHTTDGGVLGLAYLESH